MAKTLRTSGDYTIKAGAGAAGSNEITLDSKTLRILGDLIVGGDQATVNTTSISVEDAFIELAKNNTNTISLDAGIYINRGLSGNNAVFYWDESEDNFIVGTTTNNAGTSPLTNITYQNIKVATAPSDNNHAASKSYVDNAIVGGGYSLFLTGDDSNTIQLSPAANLFVQGGRNITTAAIQEPDELQINLDTALTDVNSVTSGSGQNLTLAANTSLVVINNIITFNSNATTPTATAITKLYSKTVGGGGTGIFFINSAVSSGTEGELISKKKATALAIALG